MFVFIVALLPDIELRHPGAWIGLGSGDNLATSEHAADLAPGAVG